MKLETNDKSHTDISCYVALGSNMGDSKAYINQAIKDLEGNIHLYDLVVSRFYKSKPHGPQDQPDYLNAAISLN